MCLSKPKVSEPVAPVPAVAPIEAPKPLSLADRASAGNRSTGGLNQLRIGSRSGSL